MKIAVVSRTNAPGGGASRIAEDLSRGLINAGHAVTHFCGQVLGQPETFQKPLFPAGGRSRAVKALQRRAHRTGLPLAFPVESWFGLQETLSGYDAVHVHDHANTLSLTSVAKISRRTPTFFTAHDFLHLTGGCIYPLGCEAYKTQCGPCPQRQSIGRLDFTRHNQSVARKAAQYSEIRYIYPSDWLRREAEQHLRWKIPGQTIPNGFDPRPYQFRPRAEARAALGLAADRRVICVSAHYLADPRKGLKYAIEAIRSVADLKPVVLLVGNPSDNLEQRLPGIEFWFTGLVESRARMGLLFAAADLFLFCSLQDNLPITIQESLAAATPVVGFATGGVPEMVRHEHSGWLVPTGDQEQLNAALRRALTQENLPAAGEAGRRWVAEAYAPERFIAAHAQLYEAAQGRSSNVR